MQNSLRSDSCIFAPDADSCELRVSRHPANAIRETLFPELVFIRPESVPSGTSPYPVKSNEKAVNSIYLYKKPIDKNLSL